MKEQPRPSQIVDSHEDDPNDSDSDHGDKFDISAAKSGSDINRSSDKHDDFTALEAFLILGRAASTETIHETMEALSRNGVHSFHLIHFAKHPEILVRVLSQIGIGGGIQLYIIEFAQKCASERGRYFMAEKNKHLLTYPFMNILSFLIWPSERVLNVTGVTHVLDTLGILGGLVLTFVISLPMNLDAMTYENFIENFSEGNYACLETNGEWIIEQFAHSLGLSIGLLFGVIGCVVLGLVLVHMIAPQLGSDTRWMYGAHCLLLFTMLALIAGSSLALDVWKYFMVMTMPNAYLYNFEKEKATDACDKTYFEGALWGAVDLKNTWGIMALLQNILLNITTGLGFVIISYSIFNMRPRQRHRMKSMVDKHGREARNRKPRFSLIETTSDDSFGGSSSKFVGT